MKRTCGFHVVVCLFLLPLQIVATQRSFADTGQVSDAAIVLPGDPFSFQPDSGSAIASRFCLICHSAEYVYTQPPHPTATWKKIVHKMQSAFGCPIPDDQVPQLVDYLVRQNGIQPTPLGDEVQEKGLSDKATQGNMDDGKMVYETNCANCHGSEGKGDGPVGQALVPPPSDLTATKKKSDEELLKTINNGRPGTAMPSWKGDLSRQEIQDVLSYIRSFSP